RDDAEERLLREIGPVSWLSAPLRVGEVTLGAITFLSCDPARVYGDADLPVAIELADRCAQAIFNANLYEEEQSARALLDTLFRFAPVGIALADNELRYLAINPRMEELNGAPEADHLGRRVLDVLGPEVAEVDASLRQVLETGQAIEDREFRVWDRAFLVSSAPVEVEGRVLGVISIVIETTERRRQQEAIAASEARFRSVLDTGMIGIVRGRFEQIVEANDAFLTMLGYTAADVADGRLAWPRLTPARWKELARAKGREAVERGRSGPFEQEYLRRDGTPVPVLVGLALVGDGDWIAFVVDLTERKEAERQRERLLDRTARLQAVTERLSAALTADEIATIIATEGMAATDATCGVLALPDPRDPGALVLGHRFGMPPDGPRALPLDASAPLPTAARDGSPVLLRSREAWLERFPDVPPRGDFEAFAAVPLLFEGGVAGVMGFGFADARSFDAADVDMLLAIGRQGAQALERARLYEERAYVARTLQEGLLPRALPWIPGLDLAVRYRPLGDGAEVGGDFYDVVPLDDGAWLVVVGDICGKGTAAAMLTGVMRTTIRALALLEHRPEALVRGVNEALRREASPQALATLACAAVRPSRNGFAMRLVACGHPAPLLLRASGSVEPVPAGGPMLGVGADPALDVVDLELGDGDLLLLYTDGVLDARVVRGEPFGEARLRSSLAAAAGRDATGVLDAVDGAVRAYAPGPPRDDTALLALRVTADGP
ncbi:MAG TPA: SpoIIE family protein phosphatase, partial [Solirubrobacteraceae bacterium]|nr:SpoIIE family protein phosphatase [Solirubrobacteraceae bacterium]